MDRPTEEMIEKWMSSYANDDAQGAFERLVVEVWETALVEFDKLMIDELEGRQVEKEGK